MIFDKRIDEDLRKLIGHVVFKHNNDLMYCDSAYFYKARNSLEAFGKVHLIHNDSVNLFGDYLKYNGDIRFGEVRRNVKLVDKYITLTTQNLDFDLENNLSYYFSGGKIVDTTNNLTSRNGYYFFDTKEFFFKDNVVLINPQYSMYSDTLKYNTGTEIAFFVGPTKIISDSNLIYCENGWYNTRSNISQFNRNAYMQNKNQFIKGDSLYYDRNQGLGKAFRNVEVRDTTENIILKGELAFYLEKPEYSYITGEAVFISYSETDTLFLHADTLRSKLDTSGKYKRIFAYKKVKFYREDMQGKCDSLSYSFRDSLIRLYGQPVIWTDENQLTAEYIQIHTFNNRADKIELKNSAFIVAQEDTLKFNQISGKNMTGIIKENKLCRINVDGNGQTIYYAKDNDQLVGINKAESSNLIIYLKEGKVDRINFINQPGAVLNPPHQLKFEETRLKGFQWLGKQRPVNKNDIFIWN
jgi:lipopolysaccharide export system protein LptA